MSDRSDRFWIIAVEAAISCRRVRVPQQLDEAVPIALLFTEDNTHKQGCSSIKITRKNAVLKRLWVNNTMNF